MAQFETVHRRRHGFPIVITQDSGASSEATLGELLVDGPMKIGLIEADNEGYRIHVTLPVELAVEPPDLRHHAYDHELIERLIQDCLRDNTSWMCFEPLNEELLARVRMTCLRALRDLVSVIDLKSVGCSLEEGWRGVVVTVKFFHKNGEHSVLCFRADLG